jgi:hypothetical protein
MTSEIFLFFWDRLFFKLGPLAVLNVANTGRFDMYTISFACMQSLL